MVHEAAMHADEYLQQSVGGAISCNALTDRDRRGAIRPYAVTDTAAFLFRR